MAQRGDGALASARLRYAPLSPDDLPAFHALIQDEYVRRYMLDGGVMSEDWSAARIRDSAAMPWRPVDAVIARLETLGIHACYADSRIAQVLTFESA